MLFTIGLVLMAMPIAAYLIGDEPQQVHLPAWLDGRIEVHGVGIGVYRLFIIAVCGAIAAALQIFLIKTRFGAQLRAAVDDPRVAQGLGINVDRIFAIAFAVGSGLAGLGGALAADVVGGIDPSFPVKFLVTFLIVVTIGGSNGVMGALFGSLLLGVLDVAGKYYAPSIGAFIIYAVMVVTLIVRPQGLVCARRRAMSAPDETETSAPPRRASAAARALAMAGIRLLAGDAGLDLRFAVARGDHQRSAHRRPVCFIARPYSRIGRIVSLGHAAFLGLGAYAAAILASKGFADPPLGLAFGAAVAALVGLLTAPLLLRGGDLTRLMVTLGVSLMLGELANRNGWLTGGADGLNFSMAPVLGLFPIGFTGQRNAALYSFAVLFILFATARRLAHLAVWTGAGRDPRKSPARRRARHRHQPPHRCDLYGCGGLRGRCWRAAGADNADRVARPVRLPSIGRRHADADYRRRGISLRRTYRRGGVHCARDVISAATPEYWEFWIGLALVILVLAGRERIGGRCGG